MKRYIIQYVRVIVSALFLILITSCFKNQPQVEKTENTEKFKTSTPSTIDTVVPANTQTFHDTINSAASAILIDKSEEWLISIFRCKNTAGFCYYLDKEQEICTERFWQFLLDTNEIYGPSNLTDSEIVLAERRYKKRWAPVYPIYKEEMWPFGRGNDDAEHIKLVSVTHVSGNQYRVIVNYNDEISTENLVTVVSAGNFFKIDYCQTKYL